METDFHPPQLLPSIANLMSPPEGEPLDHHLTPKKSPQSQSHLRPAATSPPPSRHGLSNVSSSSGMASQATILPPIGPYRTPDDKLRVLPSPPVSPRSDSLLVIKQELGSTVMNGVQHTGGIRRGSDLKDPLLYPESDETGSTLGEPLFVEASSVRNTEELITKHMSMHLAQFKNKLNHPTRDEYRLALACVPTVGAQYSRDPNGYLKRQREEQENEFWQIKRICARPGTKTGVSGRGSNNGLASTPLRPAKRALNALAPASGGNKRSSPLSSASSTGTPRVKRTPKPSPITKLMNFPVKGRASSPSSTLTHVKREDTEYEALPDYCPPLSTLPANQPKILKADWPSSNTLNLSQDPDRHLLHEAEVNLASTLRLSCATYLCSKRRIMESRLNALRIGKEFRKTDAQQACKIDVNKASKLWGAFERVGWFDKQWFQQFL